MMDNVNNLKHDTYTVILANKNKDNYGQIVNIDYDAFHYKKNLNSANEISFPVYKELNDIIEPQWDNIKDFRLVWVKELDEYYQIEVSLSETIETVKNVVGTSLCEAELSQVNIYNTEINTEADIDRDDYEPTVFYNEMNPSASLLNRVFEKVPHYTIKHVDDSLCNLQRTFSIDNTSLYDFLIGECSEQINCLFQFDTTDRSVSVYDLYSVCESCGYRGEYLDTCPECGGTSLKTFGEDTTIYVDSSNLTDQINYETNPKSVKNCFRLVAGDDDMTAAVIACNPNGSTYIYYFSEDQLEDMPTELVDKINSYNELYNSYTVEYQELSEEMYDCIDKLLYYRSSMMPTIEHQEVTASTEAQKLTTSNLSPLGMTTLNNYTTVTTVNSALVNYARVFVKTGYVKIEVESGTFTYNGIVNGVTKGTWVGKFKVTNYSDEDDVAYSDTLTIEVNNDYEEFLHQKIMKNISTNDESIYDVLSISSLDLFKKALTYYSYNRLESFADAIQGVLDILIEENQSGVDSSYYNSFYTPYYNKLVACQSEMNIRSATIQGYEDKYEKLINRRQVIQDTLNFKEYLGNDLYNVFCCYRREDTYQNDNFISDGLDNAQIFENALDFIKTAQKEIVKSGESQHTISSSLYNFLELEEFKDIVNHFSLGNWIRFCVDEKLYKLRLIGYEVSKDSKLNTTFSNVTRTHSSGSDVKEILNSAQSMATSFSYVEKQAEKGNKAQATIKSFMSEGLDSGLVNIKNNDKEEVTYGKHGMLCRSYDDVTNSYSDKQLKWTHNIFAFTKDNWQSTELCLGEHDYYYYSNGVLTKGTDYGLSSKFVQSGVVNGSQIIGGEIYSQNYSSTTGTYINLNDGTFSWANGKIKYDGSSLFLSGVSLEWDDINNASEYVTQITEDTVTVEYINALNITAKDISATTLSGKTIKGGAIYSNNYSSTVGTCLNLNDGTFSFGGGKIKYDGTTLDLRGVSILWDDIDDATTNVSAIAKSTINASYINALKIIAGSVDAENITGTTISGKTISGGTITGTTINNGNGTFSVDSSGNVTMSSVDITGGDIEISYNYNLSNHNYTRTTSIIAGAFKSTWTDNTSGETKSVELTSSGLEVNYLDGYEAHVVKFTIPTGGWIKCQGSLYASTALVYNDLTVNGTLYTASGTVSKSDRDVKNSIELLDLNASSNFIYSLKPSKFKYNDGTSDRYHHGLIAQEVKESMGNEDWGLYVDKNPEESGNKALRYEELIADLIATVQTLNKRVTILENKE